MLSPMRGSIPLVTGTGAVITFVDRDYVFHLSLAF